MVTLSVFNDKKNHLSSDSLKQFLSLIGLYIKPLSASNNYYPYQYQDSNSANFGTFTDSLPEGTYKAYFYAFGRDAKLYPAFLNPDAGYQLLDYLPNINFLLRYSLDYYDISNSDCFVGDSVIFTVGSSGEQVCKQTNMRRIVGLLKVKIQDADPSTKFRVKTSRGLVAGTYTYSLDQYDTIHVDESIPYYLGGGFQNLGNGEFQLYMPYVAGNFPIIIEQLAADSATVLSSKTINNVFCQRNKITLVSGNFFGKGSSANTSHSLSTVNSKNTKSLSSNINTSLSLNFNPQWNADTIRINF
ncbi:hypothetical protein A8C56_07950 [Niabella ginsenosidivorans]|uniref:Uncharacterized protein n=2 Tax=Niabella ginsenosidivorans TaxID=1176587 RepID=A0A1A9I2L4_9BACT|nr:hypothetical protein A8C56_07950 [Niabella ginsenosidivorans]